MKDQELTKKERKRQARLQRKAERRKQQGRGRIKRKLIILAVILLGAVGIYWLFSSTTQGFKIYPPTDIAGHVEQYPRERISREPISVAVQKHILEHTPNEVPGVIIQYNCKKFTCEPDLIDNLREIAQSHDHVYLAPYPQMDAKIALTAFGKLEILDEYDEQKIREFIEARR